MTEGLTDYSVSLHCEQRYAERLMGKDDKNDINKFIVENKEKIKTDLNKMIAHGDCIYTGKQSQKDGKGKVLDVYLKNTWVVLVDSQAKIIVTVYRIDLGCGEDFNQQYISRMMEKLDINKKDLEDVQLAILQESNMYKEMIADSQGQISEYKTMIKNLESLCTAYQEIIDNNIVKVSQANKEVAETVNTLIGKKEF